MIINIRDIIGQVVAEAYILHPYHEPPHIDKIVHRLYAELSKYCTTDCDSLKYKYLELVDYAHLKRLLKTTLMDIREFRQLNISRWRWNLGQRDIYDENLYTSRSEDIQENDFIDLDALIQNVVYKLDVLDENDQDCFLCAFAKEYGKMEPSDCDECRTCIANPKFANYRCNRQPHPWSMLPRNSEEYQQLVKSGKISGMD